MYHSILVTLLSAASTDPQSLKEATDGVYKFARLLDQYGPAITIMAIFFVIFFLFVFLILRSNSRMMTQFMQKQDRSDDLEEKIISKFVDNTLKINNNMAVQIADRVKESLQPMQNMVESISDDINTDKEVHKDLVGTYINVNMAFKDASRCALLALKCARVAIYVFHNGNKSTYGLPFFKMSCVHEWTDKGCNTLRGKSHIDIPLHLFDDFIECLWSNGVYKSEDISKISTQISSIPDFVSFSNTKSLYIDAIKDNNGIIAGFVVAEFEKEETFEQDDNRDKEIKEILDNMIAKISPILVYHQLYNKK